jgi:hypothetical protein
MMNMRRDLPAGWTKLGDEGAEVLFKLHKRLEDGVDVIVLAERKDEQYFITSISESRTSGPSVKQEPPVQSIDEAEALAVKVCEEWDVPLGRAEIISIIGRLRSVND